MKVKNWKNYLKNHEDNLKTKIDARQKGYHWVNTKLTGVEIVDLILENKIDGGVIGESSFVQKIHEGAPIVAVALLGYTPIPGKCILLRKGLKINSVEDFKGKTLASRRAGPGDAIFLREFIEDIGLTEKDINIIDQTDDADHKRWIKTGEIDGGLYHLHTARKLISSDAAYFYRAMDWMDPAISHAVLVFTRDYISNYPENVQKIVNAYVKRIAFENSIPEEDKDGSLDKGLMMKGDFLGMEIPKYDFPPRIRLDLLNKVRDLLLKYGYIDAKKNIINFVDNSFVEKTGEKGENIPFLKGFELKKSYTEQKSTHALMYSDGQNIVRLKIIPSENIGESEKLINTSTLTIQSLYDTTASSYPGMISNEIICDSRFIPEQKLIEDKKRKLTYFVLYLSDRLSYGACTDDLTSYKGIMAWTHCEEKRELRQFEFISPKTSFQEHYLDFVTENICN